MAAQTRTVSTKPTVLVQEPEVPCSSRNRRRSGRAVARRQRPPRPRSQGRSRLRLFRPEQPEPVGILTVLLKDRQRVDVVGDLEVGVLIPVTGPQPALGRPDHALRHKLVEPAAVAGASRATTTAMAWPWWVTAIRSPSSTRSRIAAGSPQNSLSVTDVIRTPPGAGVPV